MATGASAQTLSVVPATKPSFGEKGASQPEPLESLVSGCLDSFFSAGLIATDAHCAFIPRGEWEDPAFGLTEAKEGMVDYIVAMYTEWKPSSFQSGVWLLATVDYRLVRVSSGKVIASGSLKGPVDSDQSAIDTDTLAQSLGLSIGSTCVVALGSRSLGGN